MGMWISLTKGCNGNYQMSRIAITEWRNMYAADKLKLWPG